MAETTARQRVIALVLYAIILLLVHYYVVQPSFLPSEKVLWLFNGIASLLFGSRLLNPHFTPPADAATNGFFVIVAMLAASLAITPASNDLIVVVIVGIFGALVLLTSIFVLLKRAPGGLEVRPWLIAFDQAVRKLGSPTVIYTIVILAAVWLFHTDQPLETFAMLATWAVIVTLAPVEGMLRKIENLQRLVSEKYARHTLGVIAAHQSPGVVLIRQADARESLNNPMFAVSRGRGGLDVKLDDIADRPGAALVTGYGANGRYPRRSASFPAVPPAAGRLLPCHPVA